MGTRYNKGDIVKVKRAKGEHLPEGNAEVVKIHDLGKGQKTNYEIRHFDERMEGTGVFNANELKLVERTGV